MTRGRLASHAAIALAALLSIAAAADPAERLPNPAQEARARALFREVRCLVCQNESIDDSEADLAHDLRRIVREQVAAGRSDAEVRSFLLARYGEFVLLKPPFSWGNAALWGAPFAVAGTGLVLFILRKRRSDADEDLSPDEQAKVEALRHQET